MDLPFRELSAIDLSKDLLDHFDRHQVVSRVWRRIDGVKVLVDNPLTEEWSDQLKQEVIFDDFAHCIADSGMVLGAFHDGRLIAFASLRHEFFGSEQQYLQLMQLHVSCGHRRLGLGRRLFLLCADRARQWGAKKLYISAHSAEETQVFYEALGCVDALEINRALAEHEPFDCQLEYVL